MIVPGPGRSRRIASSIIGNSVPASSSRLSFAGRGRRRTDVPSVPFLVDDLEAHELERVVRVVLERREVDEAPRSIAHARPAGRGGSPSAATRAASSIRRRRRRDRRADVPSALVGARRLDDERAVGAVGRPTRPIGTSHSGSPPTHISGTRRGPPVRCGVDNGAERTRDLALPSDHLAEVVGATLRPGRPRRPPRPSRP